MPQKTETQKWEASILRMEEDHFFDIIHAYFGEVETPFNKHKLLERLSSFLLNEESRKKIVSALSYEDLKILSCIHYLKTPKVSVIIEAFEYDSISGVRTKLLNLEERLLIYRESDEQDYVDIQYGINPLLLDILLPFLGESLFLPYERLEEPINVTPLLTPVFFSSFYSYISNNVDVFKKDGTCKKKVYNNLSTIFPALKDGEKVIDLIFDCFLNLKLIEKLENEIIIVEEHWKKFASLTHFEKLVYICVARLFYVGKFIVNPAEIFSELLGALKEGAWYSEEDLNRVLFLIYKKHFTNECPMSSDIQYAFFNAFMYSIDYGGKNIEALDIAEKLGLLIRKKNTLSFNRYFKKIEEDEKPLLISSTYEIAISQNACFNSLFPIIPGMKIVKSQTFATFEFSRQTCEKLFQKEMDAKEIIEKLQCVSLHTVPQNIIASIEQWYQSYKSISLYSGLVLCVDEKKRKFFEKDTPLSNLVEKEISEGVYLLGNSSIKEIDKQLKKAGLDFIFYNQKNCMVDFDLTYTSLEKDIKVSETEGKKELLTKLKRFEDEYFLQEAKLIEKLEKEKLDEKVRDILYGRIKRRVILSEKQLAPSTIHKSPREIKAFDFLGKVKFLEEAKTQRYLLEITTNNKNVIIGYVASLWKNFRENTVIRIDDENDINNTQYVDVSQILKIKVVVQSIFS